MIVVEINISQSSTMRLFLNTKGLKISEDGEFSYQLAPCFVDEMNMLDKRQLKAYHYILGYIL